MRLTILQLVAWFMLSSMLPHLPHLQPTWTPAPKLVGMPTASARQVCSSQGLVLAVAGRKWDHSIPAGAVLEQFPVPGNHLMHGSSVDVLLNEPPAKKPLPNLYGKPEEHARRCIVASGYAPVFSAVPSERVPFGRVISEEPLPNSHVHCLISDGPERRTVRSLGGMNLDAARHEMATLGIGVAVDDQKPSDQPEGTIISQQPAPGSRLPMHGQVFVTLSAGQLPAVPTLVGQPLWQACLTAQHAGYVVTIDNSNAPGPTFVVTQQNADAATPGLVHLQVEAPR